jgi:uncharacterized protein YbjQ (UPF0145 family)
MTVTVDVGNLLTWLGPLLGLAVLAYGVYRLVRGIRSFFAGRSFGWDDRHIMRQRWEEVERMAQQPGEMGRKMAIVEADKLLDHALKTLSMPGATLGERLKFAQYKYPDLQQVWWAHKVRNQLVHEATSHLDPTIGRRAIKSFKRALERLGAI